MSARDELRKYVRLLADWWTSPKTTDERVERLYASVRTEVLSEVKTAIEDPGQRRAAGRGAGLGWEDARDVVSRMIRETGGGAA
ncbi:MULTISPECIES: hypothetical protein [Streptomyces]|uniref:hypothetical protein n=1 Tax=Streptomyces TaxID=1883 RepID=UPI000F797862|nr:hypothetical protein [Streptomyces sp. WAC05858]RSS39446.1 hypothetical protein EF902_27550 [Streptomyces sp. WAC05858]WTA79290.1 hypothetical protein OG751_04455 [Streptomyces antimycoticus]